MKKSDVKKTSAKMPEFTSLGDCLEKIFTGAGAGKGAIEMALKSKMEGKSLDYRVLFTDAMSKEYIESIAQRLSSAKNQDEYDAVAYELNAVASFYALVVYYAYPKKEWLRKSIAANPELSSNYKMVKTWLDANNVKEVAHYFVEEIRQATQQTEFI